MMVGFDSDFFCIKYGCYIVRVNIIKIKCDKFGMFFWFINCYVVKLVEVFKCISCKFVFVVGDFIKINFFEKINCGIEIDCFCNNWCICFEFLWKFFLS